MNATQAPIAPPKPESTPFFMIGGGQKSVSDDDLKQLTFTIRCNVECKMDERELTACIPIYEHVLLNAIWKHHGGEAKLVADWLPAMARYPRVTKLSRDMLRDEVKRLGETYRVALPNGNTRNYFKDIYGRDGDPVRGFYKIINLQVRAWHELSAKIKNGHRLMSEDLQVISDLALPAELEISPDAVTNFEDVTVDQGIAAPIERMEGELEEDPLADLGDFLSQRGWNYEVIMDLTKLLGDGEAPTHAKVSQLVSLHGKKSEQARLVADYKAFFADQEKKANAAKAKAAEKEIVPTI